MSGHLWQPGWDPEGLLGTLPAIATALLGVIAGIFLQSSMPRGRKLVTLALAGAALAAMGQLWGLVFPINKSMWTSSYVLLTGGLAALTLAAFVYLIDGRGKAGWAQPLIVLGRNALTLYVVSGLIAKMLIIIPVPGRDGSRLPLQAVIFQHGFEWLGPPEIASLSFALAFLALMYALCHFLYCHGIFLRA